MDRDRDRDRDDRDRALPPQQSLAPANSASANGRAIFSGRSRYGREHSPLPLPSRAPFASTHPTAPPTPAGVPLRPVARQRTHNSTTPDAALPSPTTASLPQIPGPAHYWRPAADVAQLPARPVNRYRSPPPAGEGPPPNLPSLPAGLPLRASGGWPARPQGRPRDRDEYRPGPSDVGLPVLQSSGRGGWRGGEGQCDSGWGDRDRDRDRERERERSREQQRDRDRDRDHLRDRDSRDRERSRTFAPENANGNANGHGRRGFEVPYRGQGGPNPRKRTRDSSDDDSRDDDSFDRGRSRPASPDWRSQRGGGRRDSPDRGPRRISDVKPFGYSGPRYAEKRDDLYRRAPSPTGSDNTAYDPPPHARRLSNHVRDRSASPPARTRSYSPGEISEGELGRRSLSPPSRSRSPVPDSPSTTFPLHRIENRPARFVTASTLPTPSARLPLRPPPPQNDYRAPVHRRTHSPPPLSTKYAPKASYNGRQPSPPPLSATERNGERRDWDWDSKRERVRSGSGSAGLLGMRRSSSPVPQVERLRPAPALRAQQLQQQPLQARIAPLAPSEPPRPPSPRRSPTPPRPVLAAFVPRLLPAAHDEPPPVPAPVERSDTPPPAPFNPPESPLKQVALLTPPVVLEELQPSPPRPPPPPLSVTSSLAPPDEPSEPVHEEESSQHVEYAEPKTEEVLDDLHAMDVDPDDTLRSPSPRSRSRSPPVSPPRDFSSILGSIIAENVADSGLTNAIIEANRLRTASAREPGQPAIRDLSNFDFAAADDARAHESIRPFLLDAFEQRDRRRWTKAEELKREYKALNDDWRAHCRRLDRIKDRIHRRHQPATVPATPSIDPAGLPFYPEPLTTTPGPSIVGRTNRRNANAAFGYGDAVRSEAEFLEILASLETADMRDPNVRATRTAAVVPDMVVDPAERADLLAFDDDRRVVGDPAAFYGVHEPLDLWTEDEVHVFCKRFSQHPKQFGRIAADLADKSTAQCVLFYYRMKNTIDFRSLSDRRGRDGRRRKTRRRADADGNAKKASLLSNLKRARTDDRDEEDDSPPPSPRLGTSRKQLVAESPSVFQAPEASLRPGPTPDELSFDEGTAPSATQRKKGRTTTPKLQGTLEPASEGMVEAAEALGALAALATANGDGDDADDDSAAKSRKRKVRLDADGLAEPAPMPAASRRKSASSSYWSVAERNEFVKLLSQYGKDWSKLAEGLENKTAVQCKNWFQNHAKKLNLAEIAKAADGDDEGDDDTGSGAVTPGGDFTVPTGIPLSESLAQPAVPRAGFFVPDGSHPRVAALGAPFEDKGATAGMQIRNLLNDDTPDEELPPPLAEGDWFGGGDGESATESESDRPKLKVTKSPPRRIEHHQQAPPQARPQAWDLPRGDDRRYAYEAPAAYRPAHSAPVHFATSPNYPPPSMDHYGGRPPVSWNPSASYPPPYGPPAPHDYYGHERGSPYPPRADFFVQKPHVYDRSYQPRPASYPPPNDRPPPHQQWPGAR